MEVAGHTRRPAWCRCIALEATEGLQLRHPCDKHGAAASSVPVGEARAGPRGGRAGPPHRRAGRPIEARGCRAFTAKPPAFTRPDARDRIFRNRHQGHRPADALLPRAARSASSAAPAWARPYSSWSSSTTSPSSTAATPCLPAWASAAARATTSSTTCASSGAITKTAHGLRPDERAAGLAYARGGSRG